MKKLLFTFFMLVLALQTFNAQTIVGFEFTNDDEGWNRNPARCSTEWNTAGYLDATTEGIADPFFFNTAAIAFSTTNVNFLELSIKNGTANGGGSLILLRTGDTNVNIPFSMTPNSTDFETILIDLSDVNNYSNNLQIDDVRIDPNNGGAAGVISFDYIRFVENPSNVVLATSASVDGPATIDTNGIAQFTTTVSPNNATFNDVTYSVDDDNIARINASGLLVPKTTGTVTVTATTTDGSNVSDSKQITITQGGNTIFSWDFTSDDQGWNRAQTRCTTTWNNAGYLDVATTGDNDPFFYRNPKIEFNASNFNFIELSVKNGTTDTQGGVFLFTSVGIINVPVTMTANSANFEDIVIDLATVNKFANNLTITDVRLDPNNSGAAGVISYDYVRLVGTPTNPILATSLSIDGPNTISTIEVAQITSTISPSNASSKTLSYSVNDANIATINADGLLVPKITGTVTVTSITTDGSNISDTKTITITQGEDTILAFEFNTNDEGWNKNPLRCTTAWNNAGYLDVTTVGENDPSVFNTTKQAFSAAGAAFLTVSVKNETASDNGTIIFFVEGGGTKAAQFNMTPNSTEFETIVVDLPATVSNWSFTDNFTDIRLDANADGSEGVVSFDYIRFTKQDATASVESQKLLDATFMYPNPVRQGNDVFLNLERFTSTDKVEISVNDITGKLIYSKKVSGGNSEKISTNQLNTGVYLVSIKNDRSFKTFKILVN
ncbi:T9SS type A sorting domain-containing protein [Polaribacter sp. Hel_I_88]|uniref:T9SS type A sorting domain-containing protein n=1 Tax=Polaribacter sp. Hel_I_88 TaxID=1250006 RepID=UPI00047D489D|nr:T9SS type A sorting domain-containing protein [Polaribacter sp. Hel_I_88]